MDFIFINRVELDALSELPLMQRVVYIMGIRPYMDRKSFIVGIKRKISYQSLRETLYVAPIKGVQTGSPSRQQMKRAIKSLEREGLIQICSTTKNLIVKCLLADTRTPAQIIKSSVNTERDEPQDIQNETVEKNAQKNSGNNIYPLKPNHDPVADEASLYEKFEQFWQCYPMPGYKKSAWEQFKYINPDEGLFERIMLTLLDHKTNLLQTKMKDIPALNSTYPAEWLSCRLWQKKY